MFEPFLKAGETDINQQYSPQLYHWFVRPHWLTKKYIHQQIQRHFHFDGKTVLDFGSGTGANCPIFAPVNYLGVDPDQNRIRFASRLYPQYSFRVLEDHLLPVADKTVDYILIIAVLHHISSEEIGTYIDEFKRILKPTGSIIVIEPCYFEKKPISNSFMKWVDKGEYIRKEEEYLNLFEDHDYECKVLDRFSKCFLYNELFFSAHPK